VLPDARSDRSSGPSAIAAGSTSRSKPGGSVDDIPDLVLVAPVEMWFGDHRVGVKAGTKTYDRFRKYADVLLGDLKAPDARAR